MIEGLWCHQVLEIDKWQNVSDDYKWRLREQARKTLIEMAAENGVEIAAITFSTNIGSSEVVLETEAAVLAMGERRG